MPQTCPPQELIHKNLTQLEAKPTLRAEDEVQRAHLRYYLAQYTLEPAARARLYQQAYEDVMEARTRYPDEVGLLLWWTALHGEVSLLRGKLHALKEIPKLEKALLELKQRSPQYQHWAADRSLGVLYHEVPAFISIGSKKKARAHLETAYRAAPEFPANALFLAQFWADQGERERARSLVEKAQTHFDKYPIECCLWKDKVSKLLRGK